MANKLFKSLFAIAMVIGTTFGFVACQDKGDEVAGDPTVSVSESTLNFSNKEESKTVSITSNASWKTESSVDWVTVAPASGKGNGTITVAVSANETGEIRKTDVKVIALHPEYGNWETRKISVSQSADEQETVTEELLYSDDFDGQEATKTYGSGSSWPYIDQFPEFANPEGDAAANVTYSGSGVSVRANSTSDSNYSDYEGSGSNNIFFGGGAYFQANDIAPLGGVNFKVTFGSEKYTQDGDSTFKPEEFLMYISKNGTQWAPVEYTFAGTEPGRWNVATANFTLAAETDKLYIKFEAKVASVYRLDDLKLYVGNGGQTIDLDNIQEPEPPAPPTTDALYFENFDGKAATQGSNGWPFIDQFPEMKNAAGPAAANVSYEGQNTSVRNNSNSDGTYSDYAGSGVNNIFFGKVENYFIIKDLALESTQKNLVLTFGGDKYIKDGNSTYSPEELVVSLSGDGEKWSTIDYTFAGTTDGRWNVATANFTLKEVPAKLHIKFSANVASAYRIDDVTLNVGEGGQEIDLSTGEAPVEPEKPDYSDAKEVTVQEFLDAAEDPSVYYKLTGEITNVANTTYGNFDLTDATGTVYIYGLCSPEGEQKYWAESGAKKGDTITIITVRSSFNGTAQGKDAIFVSLTPGEGGEEPVVPADGIYASDAPFVVSEYNKDNAADTLGQTAINGEAVTGFKLGTSKLSGYFKSGVVGVDGDKYLNFYAVAWKDKSATLYIRVDGGEVISYALNANAGATSNAPFNYLAPTDADHYAVKLEGLTATSTIEFSTDASFASVDNTTSGRAIIFGVKLTDEPIGSENPGENPGGGDEPVNPEPEPEPTVVKATVAEFLAAEESTTVIYELTGVITSVANTTYGNFYLKDSTAEVYIYGLCSPEGTKQYWAESGVKVGDTITIQTIRTSHNGTPQGKDAKYVSHVACEVVEPEVPEGCTMATIVFSEMGYANAESVNNKTITVDENISLVFSQGSASTEPTYYDDGMAIRMYQNGALLDVNANGKTIKSIEFTFANNHYYLGTTVGTLSEEGIIRTWTGEATSIQFKSTGTDKSHRAYIAAMSIIYEN